MRTKTKKECCRADKDMLIAALNSAEADLNMARTDLQAMTRAKEAWMHEVNVLHQRLDEIGKLAAKELAL